MEYQRSIAFSPGRAIGGNLAQTDLVFHAPWEILGTELVGDRTEFGVDPLVLPDVSFDWQVTYFYIFNGQGSSGAPSGTWQFQIFSDYGDGLGLTWRVAAKPHNIGPNFAGGAFRRLVKPAMDYRALQVWMSSEADGGIRFGIVCVSPPTGPATLVAGIAGNILYY
jgi:hypothetical protein